jgi:nucleoside-diphosphate-sugar epimerase
VRVLITGIDGFTGIHLSNYLKKFKSEVFGTSLKTESENIFKCDITNKAEIQKVLENTKPDYIIHLAAISFVGYSNYENFYKVNVIGTQNLLESIKNIKKVIIASSAVVYGKQNSEVLTESMCPNPVNHYGISKFGVEQIAKNFFDKFNIIITRPFNYTGLYQSTNFLVPKIVQAYKKHQKEIKLGNLDVIREINSVDFVCEVYKRLLEKDVKNEIVNIASKREIHLRKIITLMNEISGYEIKVIQDEKLIRKNEIKKLIGDNTLLTSLIGEVENKSLKKILEKMYNAWNI